MKTADRPEALIPLSGQIQLASQNQFRPALGLGRALDYSWMLSLALLARRSARSAAGSERTAWTYCSVCAGARRRTAAYFFTGLGGSGWARAATFV